MTGYTVRAGLHVAEVLADFVETRALPGTGISADQLWSGLADILARFTPRNRDLLAKRDAIQQQLDAWHSAHPGPIVDMDGYQQFLRDIGYLVPEPAPFSIGTRNVDDEIAVMAGPQLVVPSLNDRFVLNAANARWGSLYDAFYGTDALDAPPARPGGYDPVRGAAVVQAAKAFLDAAVPLADGSWADWTGGGLNLADADVSIIRRGADILLRHNGLAIEIQIDPEHPIGRDDPAGIKDVVLEAALTTIIDLEDSVAAVDAEDKVAAYGNWLGLMRGDLVAAFEKGGKTLTRTLAPDRD